MAFKISQNITFLFQTNKFVILSIMTAISSNLTMASMELNLINEPDSEIEFHSLSRPNNVLDIMVF